MQDDTGRFLNPYDRGVISNILWYFNLTHSRRSLKPSSRTFGSVMMSIVVAMNKKAGKSYHGGDEDEDVAADKH